MKLNYRIIPAQGYVTWDMRKKAIAALKDFRKVYPTAGDPAYLTGYNGFILIRADRLTIHTLGSENLING